MKKKTTKKWKITIHTIENYQNIDTILPPATTTTDVTLYFKI